MREGWAGMERDLAVVAEFLYVEADLMDEQRYGEWLNLWTDDALYWVPCNRDDADPNTTVTLIYDDRQRLEDRIFRLSGSAAFAQDPPSRMCRLISNIVLLDSKSQSAEDGHDGDFDVSSRFHLAELRRGLQTTHAARVIHRLRPNNGSFRIVMKKVMLISNNSFVGNLSFLL